MQNRLESKAAWRCWRSVEELAGEEECLMRLRQTRRAKMEDEVDEKAEGDGH
jgi:hypothetical protein